MSELVPYDQPIDLSNCDREPIHIPGQIQQHGLLLAVDRETLEIVQTSDNVARYLGRDVLGQRLDGLLTELTGIRRAFEGGPAYAHCGTLAGRGPFDIIAHGNGELGIVEAEPAQGGEVVAPDFYSFASQTVARLMGMAATTRVHCQTLADTIRELTGYDRVMIYRFAEDWSGHVWAESMVQDKGLPSYLDLHYPASDIPAQARALFLKNSVRMLVDAAYVPARIVPELSPHNGQPLDLSNSFLRGASQMYTEYLLNMGVTGSLTLALRDRDKLWGLVACHHYSPRRVSHGVRLVCELLSRVASLQIVDKLHADEAGYRARIASAHAALVEAFASGADPSVALAQSPGVVKALVESTGVATVHLGKVSSEGLVPLEQHVARIAAMLVATRRNEVVATDSLLELYPEAAQFPELACGLLAMPIPGVPGDYLMWFRPEITRTVKWAGDPRKPVSYGPMGDRLTPRKSFELWTETVRGRAEPWARDEVLAAEQLRAAATHVLVRRTREQARLIEELANSNAELDAFAYVASHDLKEPLRAMYNHAAFLLKDAGDRLAPEDVQRGESIMRLVKRTRELIDALLDYSRAGRLEAQMVETDVNALLERVQELLAPRVREARAELRVAALPNVRAVPAMLEQVFTNLLTNALKYSQHEPHIEVGAVAAGDAAFPARALGATHAFYVRDDGIGILARHLHTVFTIFKRLHAQDKYGGGSGAGLTIVKKLVERMNGEVWLDSEPGKGTTAWFCVGREQSSERTGHAG
ncbi:MAG TPA: ATP-binding protein [Polyangiales bacterium]|nr:ATP-binding protein [Polyangiales bacterium]